jgi:osmotically-inducible protein OsmY
MAAGPVAVNASPIVQATAAKPSDGTLNDRIEARLKSDATLKKYHLSVSVDNGVATVKGMVATDAQKRRAASVAKIAGVTRVENDVTVDKAADMSLGAETKDVARKTAEKTKEGVEKAADKTKDASKTAAAKTKEVAKTAGEKTKEGASTVADKTKSAVSKTGEVITDAWITTKVKADFVNEDTLKGSDINVDTNNHVVTLKGTVKTPAGRDRAIQIAKTTDGVNRVVNQLVIGSK